MTFTFFSPSISKQSSLSHLSHSSSTSLLYLLSHHLSNTSFLPSLPLPLLLHTPALSPPLSISLTITPSSPSLSMDNSSVFLRAAVCLPAYCDFHWDSFRDHSHLSRELEPRLWREINHSHLIPTCVHTHTHMHAS